MLETYTRETDKARVTFRTDSNAVIRIEGRVNPIHHPNREFLNDFVMNRATRFTLVPGHLEAIILDLDATEDDWGEIQILRWVLNHVASKLVFHFQFVPRKHLVSDEGPSDHDCIVLYVTDPGMLKRQEVLTWPEETR